MCGLCKAVFRKRDPTTTPPVTSPGATRVAGRNTKLNLRWTAWGLGAIIVALAIYGSSIVKQQRRARMEQQRRAMMPRARLAEGGENLERFRYPSPPETLPMVGEEGLDAYDYPRKTADAVGFLSLLHHRQFDAATAYITELQDAFEKDPRKEYWPIDALSAFETADPRLLPLLKEWVQRHPKSFVPHAALGIYWNAEAWAHRGTAYASKTSDRQFRDMDGADLESLTHLKKALELRRTVNAVQLYLLRIYASHSARDEQQKILDDALRDCPGCFQIRARHIIFLAPRWGGSHEEMAAFAGQSVKQHNNRKLRLLAGYVDIDRCGAERSAQRYAEARSACDRAIALGEHWYFLNERASVHADEHNDTAALADLTRSIQLRPNQEETLSLRISTLLRLEKFEQAESDLKLATLLDPADRGLDWLVGKVARYRLHAGQVAAERWQFSVARTHYHRALWWTPDNKDARLMLADLDEIQPRAENVRRQPNNFEVHMALDDYLARQNRFDEVVRMWDGFLRDNPGHARAYRERAGAHANMRRTAQALDDFEKACSAGLQAACNDAAVMRSRLGKR